MSNEPNKTKPDPSRTPIAIEKLLITHANPHGVNVPKGYQGQSTKIEHTLEAGIQGDVKTDIDYRPWMRAFRIARTRRLTRTEGEKEVVYWEPMGKPFFMPETWAVWIPAEGL